MVVGGETPQAIVVRPERGESLESALATIGLSDLLALPAMADGPVPCSLLSCCCGAHGARVALLPLSLERLLPENADVAFADPGAHVAIDDALSLCKAWASADVRIVVSRIKTDSRGRYALCAATLESLLSRGDLTGLLEKAPAHCVVIASPDHGAPCVVSDHPLLADWVGATLMGRNPYSAPRSAAWFRNGLMPRVYTVTGDTTPAPQWRAPASLKRDPPFAVYADPVAYPLGRAAHDAAEAWKAQVMALFDPLLPPPGGQSGAAGAGAASKNRGFLDGIAETLSPESMGELLETLFKGLGLLLVVHPGLKSTVAPLRAAYRIATSDNRMNVWARFSSGTVSSGRGEGGPVNVTLRFTDVASMLRLFSSPKPDLLGAMLRQQVSFDGNLNYLLKLAYLLQRVLLVVKGDFRRITAA
jgi:hypothetical protein